MSAEATASERELLEKARAGDRRGFDALQTELQPQVRRFAAHLLCHRLDDLPGTLDEVVQDVFLALLRSLGRVTEVEHLRPFLFRVCRNCCYDRMRRSCGRRHASLDEDADGNERAMQDPPDEAAMWVLAWHEAEAAMESLPECQRLALYLYAKEGLSYPEVAEAMQIDVGTVKSRISAARKRLRARMSPGLLQALGFTKET